MEIIKEAPPELRLILSDMVEDIPPEHKLYIVWLDAINTIIYISPGLNSIISDQDMTGLNVMDFIPSEKRMIPETSLNEARARKLSGLMGRIIDTEGYEHWVFFHKIWPDPITGGSISVASITNGVDENPDGV